MSKRLSLIFLLAILIYGTLQASPYHCSRMKGTRAKANKTTIANLAEDNYDVKYLKFDLQMSDTSVYVSGNVTTKAVVTSPTMPAYVFELDTTLVIDSALLNGLVLPVATISGGFVRSITLPIALTAGMQFTARVYYHGMPPGGGGGFFNGITHAVSAGGTHMVYTVSDPYVAKNWWPCKQSIQDKIDSVDMYVTVPTNVVDGSNGLLVGVDMTTVPGYWQYHWHTAYPIDYYLISVSIARYAEYRSYMHFTASTDSMLIQNFFLDTGTFNPAYKANFDSIGQFVNYLSSLYGRYPFWHEKYGVCYTNLPGGMEHQTMTTIGVPETYIIAHELAHQWFGDNVTYQDWHDVWLSEGFATFTESLFFEHFWSAAAAKTHRAQLLSTVIGDPCGRVIVTDTTTSDSLFDQRRVYNKAQGVVRMLQYLAPNDSVFFSVLKTYQQNYALGHATTANLKAIAESAYGVPLDTFFNQWVYGRGYPIYTMSWNQSGSTVYVKLVQTRSCPSYTTHFSTPLEMQLHSATADTFIKVYNSLDTQIYVFNWAPAMTNIYLNPNVWTVLRLIGPVLHDAHLSVGYMPKRELKVYPNPTDNLWEVQNTREGEGIYLSDVNGKVVWSGSTTNGNTIVPGGKLPSGNYFLQFSGSEGEPVIRLQRW